MGSADPIKSSRYVRTDHLSIFLASLYTLSFLLNAIIKPQVRA